MSQIKFLHELYSNAEELVKIVNNGRITLHSNGSVDYFKHDYVLKNDTEMRHTGYGYSFEDDQYLTRKGIPSKKIVKKGTVISLYFNVWGEYVAVKLRDGDYEFTHKRLISDEEYRNIRTENLKLFFADNSTVFNSINIKYIGVKNGKGTYKN